MNATSIHETVAELRAAKDDSGLQAIADKNFSIVDEGLRTTGTAWIDVFTALKTIDAETLWPFAKMSNGKPFTSYKQWVKATFRKATKDWGAGLRNAWATRLVDLGLSHEEAGEALNVSQSTVTRAVKDADIEAQGEGKGKATRKAGAPKSEAQKLIDGMRKFIVTMPDQGKVTAIEVREVRGVAADLIAACDNEDKRRAPRPRSGSEGQNARSGERQTA